MTQLNNRFGFTNFVDDCSSLLSQLILYFLEALWIPNVLSWRRLATGLVLHIGTTADFEFKMLIVSSLSIVLSRTFHLDSESLGRMVVNLYLPVFFVPAWLNEKWLDR